MKSFPVGVLAAGLGSRMQSKAKAKPLATLNGESLLARLFKQLQSEQATQVYCALREELLTKTDKQSLPTNANVTYFFINTDSSLHTLAELVTAMPRLDSALFTMVDTIIKAEDLHSFIAFCRALPDEECALLVTPYVDDEKPLWVQADTNGYVTALGSTPGPYVTSGMYFLTPKAMDFALKAVSAGTHKMRNFLALLVEQKVPIKTFVVSKTIDVDHPSDLEQAERFLRSDH